MEILIIMIRGHMEWTHFLFWGLFNLQSCWRRSQCGVLTKVLRWWPPMYILVRGLIGTMNFILLPLHHRNIIHHFCKIGSVEFEDEGVPRVWTWHFHLRALINASSNLIANVWTIAKLVHASFIRWKLMSGWMTLIKNDF